MRYIGSKKKLGNFIVNTVKKYCGEDISDKVFCDLFAGTGVVGKTFAPMVKQVLSNDFEKYSFLAISVLLNGYDKEIVGKIIYHLNGLEGITDYPIFQEYAIGGEAGRMYYSTENGKKISAARKHLEDIEYLLSENDYNAALLSVIEASDKVANTMSTYGAYSKKLKDNSSKAIVFEMPVSLYDQKPHIAFNEDANVLISNISGDILYLDPPYNSRQYGSNYHLLNALITLNMPDRDSVTGVPTVYNKSDYCSKRSAKNALRDLIAKSKFEWIFLSYNNEGILSFDDIKEIFSSFGDYWVESTDYQRYKADNNRQQKAERTCEYIHVLHKGVFSQANSDVEDPAKAMMDILAGKENTVEYKVSEWKNLGFHMSSFSFKPQKETYVAPKAFVSEENADSEKECTVSRPCFKLVFPKTFEPFEGGETYDKNIERIRSNAKKTRDDSAASKGNEPVVSPMNYMGGKKKLIKSLTDNFPNDIKVFIDLFCGGATVGINATADWVLFNDNILPLIEMYKYMKNTSVKKCLEYIDATIEKWNLVQGKEGETDYYRFRDEHYNSLPVEKRHPLDLFILMAFSFNNQIRFAVNKNWKFNIPFGKDRSSFNSKMRENLIGFVKALHKKNCFFLSSDFMEVPFDKETFVYADPPYLVSQATYNDGWDETCERNLLRRLRELDEMGGRFALSNVLENKGKTNEILKEWVEENGYNVVHLNKSYSNSYYNRKKKESATDEVLITNYKL